MTTAPAETGSVTLDRRDFADIQRVIGRGGWELTSAEVDLTKGTVRIELRGSNGRLVTFDASDRGTTLTREQMRCCEVAVGRKGDRCRVNRLHVDFLGRTKHASVPAGLHCLALYLVDNAARPLLDATRVHKGLRRLLEDHPR